MPHVRPFAAPRDLRGRSGSLGTVVLLAALSLGPAAGGFAQEATPPDSAAAAGTAPEPILARLAFARDRLAAAGVEDPLPQPGPLAVTFERGAVHQANGPGRSQVRTLAGVVRAFNAHPDRTVLIGPGVRLTAGSLTFAPNAVPDGVSPSGSFYSAEAADLWTAPVPVEPGAAVELPAAFFGVPGSEDALPDPLRLVVPHALAPADRDGEPGEGEPGAGEDVKEPDADAAPAGERFETTLDVAAYHRGLVGLTVRRVGPADALAVFAVTGEMTGLGRYAVIDALREAGAAGVRRGVLIWENVRPAGDPAGGSDGEGERAGPSVVAAVPPLPPAAGGFDPGRSTYRYGRSQMSGTPATRAGLAEFHLAVDPYAADPATAAALAADRTQARRAAVLAGAPRGASDEFGARYETPHGAAAAALRTALRALGPVAAERQIVAGDPLVRPGAVRFAGPNLPDGKVPLLAGLAADPDPAVRGAAAAALGAFDAPAARETLAGLLRSDDGALAAAAATALATSRFPAGPRALAAALAADSGALAGSVFGVLAVHPHPAWADTLAALAADPDAPARAAALRTTVKSGHPDSARLLADAVRGDGPAAAAAFALLANADDPAAEALAADYARRAVAAAGPDDPLDEDVTAFLARVRPAGAAGPLWDLFARRPPGDRGDLIDLLADLAPGGDADFADLGDRLADRWDELEGDEPAAALAAVADLAPGRLPPLAGRALAGGDAGLERAALAALESAGVSPAELDRLLTAAFAAAGDEKTLLRLGFRLASRATPAARAAVLDQRWSDHEDRAALARDLAGRLHVFGPARAFFLRAQEISDNDGDGDGLPDGGVKKHGESLPFLDKALQLDPDAASGWSARGFARGQDGRLEAARDDYRAALERDPYDNIAVTGLAILEIELGGDLDGAFARAEAGLEKYPDNNLYAYNLACVYGVAAKARLAEIDAENPADDPVAAAYIDKAREHLVRSYQLGFDSVVNRDHTARDPDLDALHGDPVFEQVVAGTLPVEDRDETP